ncbi:MAG: tetratricopeptide repeat protein [Alphaproteobacteria bacterium]
MMKNEDIYGFARFSEAHALGQLGRQQEAIAAYDDVIARYDASIAPELQEWVARALVSKGVELALSEQLQKAIDVWDKVIQRYGASDASALQEHVANALYNKAASLILLGQYRAGIAACDDIIARYGQDKRPEIRPVMRGAYFYKARAYARMGQTLEAFSALQIMRGAGYPLDYTEIEQNTDFDSIRRHPDFKKFRDENKGGLIL